MTFQLFHDLFEPCYYMKNLQHTISRDAAKNCREHNMTWKYCNSHYTSVTIFYSPTILFLLF